MPLAGWAPDPLHRFERRYWDGDRWTEHVSNGQLVGSDPVDATSLPSPDQALSQPDRTARRAERLRQPKVRRARRIAMAIVLVVGALVVGNAIYAHTCPGRLVHVENARDDYLDETRLPALMQLRLRSAIREAESHGCEVDRDTHLDAQ